MSNFIYLPRLLPAPQTFLRTSRPERLETPANARVIGIRSGNSGEKIHHIAHALHRGDKLPANTVQLIRVKENDKFPRPSVRAFGPLAWLSLAGFAMSASLTVASLVYEDGMALLATVFLSLLSTNTGIANKWNASPDELTPDPNSPPGDVVIKYPQGAFIVVLCDERTARYLYFNPSERCNYSIRSSTTYRGLSLISTLLLMGGVICLANATIQLQVGFAGAYMIINICYWIGAALPPARHWNMARFNVTEIEIIGAGSAPRKERLDGNRKYTDALWTAIAVTRSSEWVREAGWAPKTPAWKEWLDQAQGQATDEAIHVNIRGDGKEEWKVRSWDPKKALSQLLSPASDDRDKV